MSKLPAIETAETSRRSRKPGRPSAGDLSGAALRDAIVAASALVYTDTGYRDCSVARILKVAKISRPTFYRYFRDRDEVLEVVIGAVNDDLRDTITRAVGAELEGGRLLEALVDAYFEWGQRIGAMTVPIYREIHDEASPASSQRRRIVTELVALFEESEVAGGRARRDPLVYEAAIHLVEHLGHVVFASGVVDDRELQRRRPIILCALHALMEYHDVGS